MSKYWVAATNSALRQSEILSNVKHLVPAINWLDKQEEGVSFTETNYPFVVIVAQDCDLDWDFKARQKGLSENFDEEEKRKGKLVNSILLCEAFTAKEVREAAKKYEMNGKKWDLVKTNRDERFHFLEQVSISCDAAQLGVPELTLDFKRIFSLDADFLYKQVELRIAKRRCVLQSPYLENLSQRFHSYHSRIALPEQYMSTP